MYITSLSLYIYIYIYIYRYNRRTSSTSGYRDVSYIVIWLQYHQLSLHTNHWISETLLNFTPLAKNVFFK